MSNIEDKLNYNYDIDPLIEKRPVDSYPTNINDAVYMISVNKNEAQKFGSVTYRVQKYPADVDVFEIYEKTTDINSLIDNFEKSIKKIVKNIKKKRLFYFSEMKVGVDYRYDIDIGNIINGKYTPNSNLSNIVNDYYLKKLLSKDETEYILFILEKMNYNQYLDGDDYDVISNIFRERYILRWSESEILSGKKKLVGGIIKTLNEALYDQTAIKIDIITLLNGKFVEVTNFFILVQKDKETGEYTTLNMNYDFENLQIRREHQIIQLSKEIEKFYYSNKFYSPFKVIKRMFALARSLYDEDMIQRVTPIVTSNIGILYQIKSEIDTILLIYERSKSIPKKNILNSTEQLKFAISSVTELDNIFVQKMNILFNDLHKNLNLAKKNLAKKNLTKIKQILKNFIIYFTVTLMDEYGINPPPIHYLPINLKYNSNIFRGKMEIPEDPFDKIKREIENQNFNNDDNFTEYYDDFLENEGSSEDIENEGLSEDIENEGLSEHIENEGSSEDIENREFDKKERKYINDMLNKKNDKKFTKYVDKLVKNLNYETLDEGEVLSKIIPE